ncbi:MAG: tRNA epoxyqueuosine(34) reductase QueG, partial [Longimicrobiales bacterium]
MRAALARKLAAKAGALGLDALGICRPDPSDHLTLYREWLERGFHGEMGYLAREDAVARRGDLRRTMEEVRSVVVVAQGYGQEDPPGVPEDRSRGVVARYARGEDYHDVLKGRLLDLLGWVRNEARETGLAEEVRGFAYVDTGPILERELARRGGLGWFGKNTMLIHPRRGSYFFLGTLLLDLELPPSEPFEADRCGSCRACLDACPTGALLGRDGTGAPLMDARRCISYLTIELKGPIPSELRAGIGNRIFGCDICQEVCPWNRRFAEPSKEPAYRARGSRAEDVPDISGETRGSPIARAGTSDTDGPELVGLLGLTEEEFSAR